jgi:MFS family permease
VFLLNAASFVLSAGLVATVRGSFRVDHHDDEVHRGLRAGFRFLMSEPTLRTLTLAFAVFAVAVGGVLVAELPLAESFDAGALGFGLIATCFGAGALAGSLAGRLLNQDNERKVLVAASFVTALGFGAVAGAPAFGFVLVAMLVAGASDGLVDVGVELMLQRLSPDAVRSRVIAAIEAIFLLGLTLAFVFAGPLVDSWGPRAAYAVAGAGLGVTALMLLPLLRSGPRTLPETAST